MNILSRQFAVVDFETKKIEDRPAYPPVPVGVAIKVGRKREYLAWGHPTENNCSRAEAVRRLKQVYSAYPVVFHNCAFDIEVGMKKLGLKMPKEYHDTLFLAFLFDPRAITISLKPLAERHLDMPPEEQMKLKEWILKNVPEATEKDWGAYISEAPGKLVGKYAIGDVDRTEGLFRLFYKHAEETGMLDAYYRELQTMPVVIGMEERGIAVAQARLKRDLGAWESAHAALDKMIRKKLKITRTVEEDLFGGEFNLGSGLQLAKALDHAGLVEKWIKTPKGQRSTKRANLEKVCQDKKLLRLIAMHGVLSTYISTFGRPWLESAMRTGGRVFPHFNQVRSTDDWNNKNVGTRTGRFSSSRPNFQNVPANVEESKDAETLKELAKFLKDYMRGPFTGLRDYLVPDEGCVFIGRDYSQQELRILAHYEEGALLQAYLEDIWLDVHTFVQAIIHSHTGVKYPRKFIKVTVFGLVYGMGAEKLAGQLGIGMEEARKLKAAVLNALPGMKALNKELKQMARRGEPLVTWGGRQYYCEEPKIIKGKMRTFEYKMLNLLIQGSAADCTKQAMINVNQVWSKDCRLVVQVHDELLGCVPKGREKQAMKQMMEAMEDVAFDVPMLTEGKKSSQTWARMSDYEAVRRKK